MESPSQPNPGSSRLLELATRFGVWGAEDPRFFKVQGTLWLCYTDGWGMGLAELSASGEVVRCGLYPREEANRTDLATRQKNWGFYEAEGKVYLIHWTCPHIAHEADLENWTLGQRTESKWVPPVLTGELHGGSNVVAHAGLLWRVVHSHGPSAYDRWRRTYRLWMMAFDPQPPFAVRLFSAKPLVVGIPESDPGSENVPADVVFCGSLTREGEGWRLTFGQNDKRMRTGVMRHDLLMPHMLAVE